MTTPAPVSRYNIVGGLSDSAQRLLLELTEGCPFELESSPVVLLTPLTAEHAFSEAELNNIPATAVFNYSRACVVYNAAKQRSELCIIGEPIQMRAPAGDSPKPDSAVESPVEALIEAVGTPPSSGDVLPYFVLAFEPWRSSTTRNWVSSLTMHLMNLKPSFPFFVIPVGSAKAAELRDSFNPDVAKEAMNVDAGVRYPITRSPSLGNAYRGMYGLDGS